MSLARLCRWEFSEKVLKGTQENCLDIILYTSKKFFYKRKTHAHNKTVEPNDFSLSNDLFGICKDMWD